eukprot:11431466-Alexandrium_andersonii.AAC.1
MSQVALSRLRRLCAQCAVSWRDSGQRATMKWHVLAHHLPDQMKFAGNMTWTHNYADESENFQTRVRGSSCSRKAYARMFLTKWLIAYLHGKEG